MSRVECGEASRRMGTAGETSCHERNDFASDDCPWARIQWSVVMGAVRWAPTVRTPFTYLDSEDSVSCVVDSPGLP